MELSLHVKMKGRLYYEWSFEVVIFLYIFCNNCYHQIEMISFIKLFPVIRFFLLQLMLGKVSSFCCSINMMLDFNVYNWFCVVMCWGVRLGRRRVAFLLWPIFFLLLRWIFFAKMLSSCAPSGGKIWNQDCCSTCVFHLCWGWVTRIVGGGRGGTFPGVFAIFYFYRMRSLAS